MDDRIVIALGGNALGNTPQEQQDMIEKAAKPLVDLIANGNEILISHGNGPQVGMIGLAFEEGSKANTKVPPMPLPECTAMSQGYIGYHIQKAIKRELLIQNMPWHVATIVTQVEVDPNDPAFETPTKPIGPYYTKEQAEEIMNSQPEVVMAEDAGRGYRQMVASPKPINIVEKASILSMLDNEFIVVASGGGGIPVYKDENGFFQSVPAVIDKDFSTAKLADAVDAEYLFILTAVDRVSINWGKPNQENIAKMSYAECQQYCKEGHFAKGSMLPKVQAAMEFVKGHPKRKAIIASLEKAPQAIEGKTGTVIYFE